MTGRRVSMRRAAHVGQLQPGENMNPARTMHMRAFATAMALDAHSNGLSPEDLEGFSVLDAPAWGDEAPRRPRRVTGGQQLRGEYARIWRGE
jgi:hypothetical protein